MFSAVTIYYIRFFYGVGLSFRALSHIMNVSEQIVKRALFAVLSLLNYLLNTHFDFRSRFNIMNVSSGHECIYEITFHWCEVNGIDKQNVDDTVR